MVARDGVLQNAVVVVEASWLKEAESGQLVDEDALSEDLRR
jgi:hypothetical protein